MIGALRPAGALLAALALWALGLVALTAAGLGGRVALHPDDPALTPAVPQVRLEVIGSRLRAFVNGELKVETTDANALASGRNAMIMYKAAVDYTDYFVYQP